MKRFLFSTVLVLVALVLLVVAGAGIFLSTLDLGKYRGQLSTVAEKALGRSVLIEGDIGHSLMPLGLSLERVIVKNTPEFGAENFLLVENVALKVDLPKLLTGTVSVDEVSVGNAEANLVVSKAGKKNWEFGAASDGGGEGDATRGEALVDDIPEGAGEADSKELQLNISNVTVDNTAVAYVDLKSGTDVALRLDKVEFSNIALDIDMPVAVKGVAVDRKGGQQVSFSLKGIVKAETAGNVLLRIEDLQADVGKVNASQQIKTALKGEILYESQLQSVNVNGLSGTVGGIDFSTTLAAMLPGGPNLAKGYDLDVRGEVTLGDINEGHLAALGSALGDTKTKDANGKGGMANKGGSAKASSSGSSGSAPDFSALKPLLVKLAITVKSFSHDGLRLDNVKTNLSLDGGRVTAPYSFAFYGGDIAGTASANLMSKPVSWKIDNTSTGVNMANLMMALTKKSDVTGTLGAKTSLSGTGMEPDVIKRTAAGTMSFVLRDGVVKADMPSDIKSLLNVRDGIPVSRAEGNFSLGGGVVQVQKIEADSSLATAQGKGQVNLLKETLVVTLDVQPGGVPPSIPLVIDGSLKNPSFNWHASRMLEDTARQIIEDPVGSIGRAIDIREDLKSGGKAAEENIKGLGKEIEGVGKELEGLFRRKK